MIDRGGPGRGVGEALLEHARVLFAWWHWVRDGTWKRSTFQSYVRTLRASFKMEWEGGTQSACPKTAATCKELLAREAALWTFVRVEGIEPTNNAAERSLRGAVLWRKVSFGTQSESGSRFVASMLTVLISCQQQQRDALAYLTACCRAFSAHRPIPSPSQLGKGEALAFQATALASVSTDMLPSRHERVSARGPHSC